MKPNRKYDKDSVFISNKKSKPCIYEPEKNFERILNDYSLDTVDKERAIKRYIKTFRFNE